MACWNTNIRELNDGRILVESGTRSNSYFGKFWVARILGEDEKYGLKREFINGMRDEKILTDGIYEVFRTCNWAKRPERYYLIIQDGNYEKSYDVAEIIIKLKEIKS